MNKIVFSLIAGIMFLGGVYACGCGDGIIQYWSPYYEQCDDGLNNGIPCNPAYGGSCEYCSCSCGIETLFGGYCGDGNVDSYHEECDGEENCRENCTWEIPETLCGNNITESGENCDWGLNNGIECNPLYGDSCEYCTDGCVLETLNGGYCGDGVCDEEENCSTCSQDCGECPSEPYCGDGIVNGTEECDDGNNINGDGCSSTCMIEINQTYKRKSSNIYQPEQFCDPLWKCTGWTSCEDGIKTRKCQDINFCEVQYNKPVEETGCEDLISPVLEENKEKNFWLISLIVLLGLLVILGIVGWIGK